MSPSWHNRLYVALSPERISMVRLGRGLNPKLQAKYDEEISLSDKQPFWQGALDKFAELLDQPEWQKAEVSLVLSNRLARFAVVAFDRQLKTFPAQEAFARHALTQTYGATAEQWDLRIQRGKDGAPSLVCAIDQALLDGLRQICLSKQVKLSVVAPYLASAFNRIQKEIKTAPAWLVINEPGYSLVALLSEGGFVSVNGIAHDNSGELPMLLDRENLVSATDEPCKSVYLYAPLGAGPASLSGKGYEFKSLGFDVLDGYPSASEGLYAMAMSEFM